MAKYIKAIDVWDYSDAIMSGQIKLQTGQWVKLGKDNKKLSRFHHANRFHITAFHYPNHIKQFNEYAKTQQKEKIITAMQKLLASIQEYDNMKHRKNGAST
jgi:hypothetical protein